MPHSRSIPLFGFLTAFTLAGLAALQAQGKEPAPLPFNPQEGETVVFLGDSITHQCLYTQYLEDFFVTRYPDRRIHFHNAGVSGDRAADALARFDQDVAAYNPTYVTVLLGMNDGQYADFDPEIFATYREDMGKVLDRIKEIGAKPILLSPTMFDHGVTVRRKEDPEWRFRERSFSPYYNALMAFYGGWALEEAGRRDIPFVNLWAPLNTHTVEQRRTNPDFSMVEDAIHPQASGQLIMAFEMLSQLGVEKSSTNAVTLSKSGRKGWAGANRVTDFQVNEDETEISFTHLAESLPWVIPVEETALELKWKLPSDGRVGYKIAKAGHKMSADRLKIAGLAPGTYEVAIDDQVIGQWSHVTLGTKIEIQENEKTPQYQQALQVALLNQKRNDEVVRPLRDTWSRIKGLRKKVGAGDESAQEAMDKALADAAALKEEADNMLNPVYQAAQPQERHWVIRKVK